MRYRFGEKIREVRERSARTLKDVAAAAGVSESLVSQIERNKVSPALDTLLAIADALDLDLEYLFADYRKERSVRVVRKADRALSSRPGVAYERFARIGGEGDGRFGMEAYQITLAVGAETGNEAYGHPGFELGIVTEGRAELVVGSRSHFLEEGDSASFQADAPHRLRNAGEKPLRALWIVSPPKDESSFAAGDR